MTSNVSDFAMKQNANTRETAVNAIVLLIRVCQANSINSVLADALSRWHYERCRQEQYGVPTPDANFKKAIRSKFPKTTDSVLIGIIRSFEELYNLPPF